MINLGFYLMEFKEKWKGTILAEEIDDALQSFGWFIGRYPLINQQTLEQYAKEIAGETYADVLRRAIVGKFLSYIARSVDPEFQPVYESVSTSFFPQEDSFPAIDFDESVHQFLALLDEMYLSAEEPDPGNWQSVARYLAVQRDRAMFHTMVFSRLTIVRVLELDRKPFQQWWKLVGSEFPLFYNNGRPFYFYRVSLLRISQYLASRNDEHTPLFISSSPSASVDSRLTRELAWHNAKQVWGALGYPERALKALR